MNGGSINRQQTGGGEQQESEGEVVVIRKRLPTASSAGSGSSGTVSIVVHIGDINNPDNFASEFFRALTTGVTDFDLDPSFTLKQREIVLKAIKGLADHPGYAAKMAELLAKGADINIVADYSGRHTGSDYGITEGKNGDGTVDRGESITIYVNMNYGGAPTTDATFANTIVHELLHTFGDPALDAQLDAPGSTYDRGPTRDIFSGYNFMAPAGSAPVQAEVISVPEVGGTIAGAGEFAVFNGSDYADQITPGSGGGLVYSGRGDDRIVLTAGAAPVELADGGGNDTVELGGVSLADVSLRWSGDGSTLAVLVAGATRLIVLDADGGGAVETLAIGGVDYSLASLPQAINHAPMANQDQSKMEGSFFGGYVGDASASDLDGDRLTYKLETVSGEYADAMWRVDPGSGAVFGDFTRMAREGGAYSYVTVTASDGVEATTSTLTIWWTNRNELPMPEATRAWFGDDARQAMETPMYVEAMPLGSDRGPFHV